MVNKLVHFKLVGLIMILCLALIGCGNTESSSSNTNKSENEATEANEKQSENNEEQTITYLEKEYTIPAEVNKIATASLESMEDAAVLGVKPDATITVGGEIPDYLSEELEGATSIGEKKQPDYETLLSIKPDVIFGTSKFQPDVVENLNKVATMLPVSHIATDWEANLQLMGEVTGNKEKADEVINQYKEDAAALKEKIAPALEGKKVVMARIRGGNIFLYQTNVYFNPVLYSDLGIEVPEELKAVKAQEMISLEKFAELNPDYLFVQFAESENADNPKALEDLQSNPIWNSIQAVKDGNVFVNSVDPMAQGGTAWSKTAFLEAIEEIAK